MGRSCMSRILLLCFLLCISSNNGFGRKLVDKSSTELGKGRIMFELDYEGTGPNVNGRSVYPLPTLPQPFQLPPPPPPPPPPPESGY